MFLIRFITIPVKMTISRAKVPVGCIRFMYTEPLPKNNGKFYILFLALVKYYKVYYIKTVAV